jgi:drug/metabolite transporter (DMT)-like permease
VAHLSIIKASTLIPANRIAPAQYSQLIWAIAIGFLFFSEIPDGFAFLGLFMIAASGILIFLREEKRLGPRRKLTLFRNRL